MGDTGEGRPLRAWVLCALLGITGLSGAQAAASASQLRCGWWQNPTPGNAWLNDRHGRWTVGSQGGAQAEGDWPSFTEAQWVRVVADAHTQRVTHILSATAKPLAACRQDRHLREPPRPE